jgi:sugar/nucleoside kinase (ribokinase family)
MGTKLPKLFDAVVAGHLCVDIFPDLSQYPPNSFIKRLVPGRTLHVGDATFSTGGSVSNTGQAFHKLGVNVRLMGKIGEDSFGQTVREVISKRDSSLTESLIVAADEGTSYTIILNSPGTDRLFLHYPGMNDTFTADDIDFKFVSRAKLFHFGYPPLMRKMYEDNGENLSKIMRKAKESQVITSLDMALPDPNSESGKADWATILLKTLPYVDIFMPSFEEIIYMVNRPLYDQLINEAKDHNMLPLVEPKHLSELSNTLLNHGVKIVAIKLGDRGFYVRTSKDFYLKEFNENLSINIKNWSSREAWAPCFKANLVGTAGSGDATVAGFLAALLRSLDLEEAMRMAVAVGACCVEALDTTSGIQAWEHTEKRIKAGWERHTLELKDPEWSFNEKYYYWEKGA